MTRADAAWHLSYNDRWAAAAPGKWPCLSPIEALAQCAPTQSNISLTHLCVLNSAHSCEHKATQVSCHPLHHKRKHLTCPRYKPENQWGLFSPSGLWRQINWARSIVIRTCQPWMRRRRCCEHRLLDFPARGRAQQTGPGLLFSLSGCYVKSTPA